MKKKRELHLLILSYIKVGEKKRDIFSKMSGKYEISDKRLSLMINQYAEKSISDNFHKELEVCRITSILLFIAFVLYVATFYHFIVAISLTPLIVYILPALTFDKADPRHLLEFAIGVCWYFVMLIFIREFSSSHWEAPRSIFPLVLLIIPIAQYIFCKNLARRIFGKSFYTDGWNKERGEPDF